MSSVPGEGREDSGGFFRPGSSRGTPVAAEFDDSGKTTGNPQRIPGDTRFNSRIPESSPDPYTLVCLQKFNLNPNLSRPFVFDFVDISFDRTLLALGRSVEDVCVQTTRSSPVRQQTTSGNDAVVTSTTNSAAPGRNPETPDHNGSVHNPSSNNIHFSESSQVTADSIRKIAPKKTIESSRNNKNSNHWSRYWKKIVGSKNLTFFHTQLDSRIDRRICVEANNNNNNGVETNVQGSRKVFIRPLRLDYMCVYSRPKRK
jgi:hypothetical protein